MKKQIRLFLAALLTAAAIVSLHNVNRAEADAVGTWLFPTFVTRSGTVETHNGPVTIASSLTVTGAQTYSGTSTQGTAGTVTLNGAGTAATTSSNNGLTVLASYGYGATGQNSGINISSTIYVNSSYETLVSSGRSLLLTGTPTVATTTVKNGANLPDGTFLVLTTTTSYLFTFQSNATLSNSLLQLGATTRVVKANTTLTLIFNATLGKWLEISYIDGNN